MKNLKKAEWIVIALTLSCLLFTAGYFVGRGAAVQVISFAPSSPTVSASPAASASSAVLKTAETPDATVSAVHTPDAAARVTTSPVSKPSGSSGKAAPEAAVKININTASAAKLDELPGIGPVLARSIVDYRTKIGGFKNIEQIMDVDGIGEKKYDAIKDLITIG